METAIDFGSNGKEADKFALKPSPVYIRGYTERATKNPEYPNRPLFKLKPNQFNLKIFNCINNPIWKAWD